MRPRFDDHASVTVLVGLKIELLNLVHMDGRVAEHQEKAQLRVRDAGAEMSCAGPRFVSGNGAGGSGTIWIVPGGTAAGRSWYVSVCAVNVTVLTSARLTAFGTFRKSHPEPAGRKMYCFGLKPASEK